MFDLVETCSRCHTQAIGFDVLAHACTARNVGAEGADRQSFFELFAICRHCKKSTVFLATADERKAQMLLGGDRAIAMLQGVTLNNAMNIFGHVTSADTAAVDPPASLPPEVDSAFSEGARCLAIGCFSAAGAMFRLCIDLASEPLLPPPEVPGGPNHRERRDLGLRLPWLFANKLLADDLHDLAHCVKEDGNDAAHRGTLTKVDAEDLLDFTRTLLERLYSQPAKIAEAKRRRDERRNGPLSAT